ncbi:UPF0184 protein AAEL002161 [Sabethes cyaneus]|uniref:UPF0184 protein AAEL002161 n=1 Tax=Sabethes cyaneus TaxID=53552 RepID=UPI00221E31C5|nr:UPF0184 protein AAEL002161 [Sabethes cyaneus]
MTPDPKENKPKPEPPSEDISAGNSQDEQTSGEESEEVDIEVSLDEYDSINSYLDSLNSALDTIEQRNDDLKTQLLNLLQSNREIRQSMQEEHAKRTGSSESSERQEDNGDAMEH